MPSSDFSKLKLKSEFQACDLESIKLPRWQIRRAVLEKRLMHQWKGQP